MSDESFHVGVMTGMAARSAVESGICREDFLHAAAIMFDAYTNNYSEEVFKEAMLSMVPAEYRDEARKKLEDV